jgi:hypothetical protein
MPKQREPCLPTGMSKIILVKGGHGLENVRLNLFRVFCRVLLSLTNVINNFFGTNDWPTSTFFTSHRASFPKHTDTICMHKNPDFDIQLHI